MKWLALLFTALTGAGLHAQSGRPYERVMLTGRGTRTMKVPALGSEFAVTSMRQQATLTAARVLLSGGNAFDAIVAGQAVLGVVQAFSNGIGGDATLLVYDAKAKKVWSLNAEGSAPKLATIEWYKKNRDGRLPLNDSLLSGTVPGVIDAWYLLLSRWGTKTFGELLAPAIEIAEHGYPITEGEARSWNTSRELRKYPTTARLYAPEGQQWRGGELFRNPGLARTFRRLVEAEKKAASAGRLAGLRAARDLFYKGQIAREMAEFSQRNGGLFRYEDFAAYTAKVEEPVSVNYRGYEVFKNRSATQGPAELVTLNLLEGYDLKAMGQNSAQYIHTVVEAIKLGMADRDKYMGDDDAIRIPWAGLLSKEYAAGRRKLIDPAKASREFRAGDAERFAPGFEPLNRPSDVAISADSDHDGDTSYIAVVDRQRNAISFTPSLHSGLGTKVVMGDLGFSFNCRGDYFSMVEGHANALAPGKRPRSTLQGTLVLKDGKPFLLAGSPGGDEQVVWTLQTLLNVVDFGMGAQQAIETPRFSTKSFPSSPFPHEMYPGELTVESRVPETVRAALLRKGHELFVQPAWSQGSNAAILLDPATGALEAAADPRVPAVALAW
ncbi:MAG: gamma-glutamyltransferase [Bryobacterales bacterium]|nr:gamma-glutamyltransferase [Bryobacterales bacterium]